MAFKLAHGKTVDGETVGEYSHPLQSSLKTTWWQKLLQRRADLAHDCSAVSATEYAIMLALIILVAAGAIRMIGEDFQNLYTMIANAVGDTM